MAMNSNFGSKKSELGKQPDGDLVELKADGGAVDVGGTSVSSTTPLSSGAQYQSGWCDTDGFKSIEISIATDQVSAADGIVVEYTADANAGTPTEVLTKTFTFDATSVAQGDLSIFIPPRLDGCRITYINGTTDQGSFNISMTLRTSVCQVVNIPVGSTINDNTNTDVTRAVISGKDVDGNYSNVSINKQGALETSDFLFSVARGNFSDISITNKFGYNSDIDTGAGEDVWAGGGSYTGQPLHSASAEAAQIFSSSAADTSAGTGARTVRVSGLDADWVEQTVDVTLNGTSGVTLTGTWRRINRAYVLTAGTGQTNAGTLTIRHVTTTTNVFAIMPTGNNQTLIGAYTVPAGKTMYIVRLRMSIGRSNGSAGSANVSLKVRNEGAVYRGVRNETITTNYPLDYTLKGAIAITEKSDVLMSVISVSDNNTACSGAFEYVLVDN